MSVYDCYEDYDGCYSLSKEFPKEALERIPSELLETIDNGNKQFFSDLQGLFPETFAVLTGECSNVVLLESITERIVLTGSPKIDHFYHWGLMYGDRLISISIPICGPSDSMKDMYLEDVRNCLPAGFESFYLKMDGISIPELGIGTGGYDLPSSPDDWTELQQYCENNYLPSSVANDIYSELPGSDLRVFVQFNNGGLVLCDISNKLKKLYFVSSNTELTVIDDPIKTLDICFSKAIKGEGFTIVNGVVRV